MIKRQFKISSEAGIHARPATLLVQAATRYNSKVILKYQGKQVDLKSIMGVMSLGVGHNAKITIMANGDDEKEALKSVSDTMYKEGLSK